MVLLLTAGLVATACDDDLDARRTSKSTATVASTTTVPTPMSFCAAYQPLDAIAIAIGAAGSSTMDDETAKLALLYGPRQAAAWDAAVPFVPESLQHVAKQQAAEYARAAAHLHDAGFADAQIAAFADPGGTDLTPALDDPDTDQEALLAQARAYEAELAAARAHLAPADLRASIALVAGCNGAGEGVDPCALLTPAAVATALSTTASGLTATAAQGFERATCTYENAARTRRVEVTVDRDGARTDATVATLAGTPGAPVPLPALGATASVTPGPTVGASGGTDGFGPGGRTLFVRSGPRGVTLSVTNGTDPVSDEVLVALARPILAGLPS